MAPFFKIITGGQQTNRLNNEPIRLDPNDGSSATVRVRRHSRARRLTLRYSVKEGGAVVTLPKRYPRDKAVKFVRSRRSWINDQISRHRPRSVTPDHIMFRGNVTPVKYVASRGLRGEVVSTDQGSEIILYCSVQNRGRALKKLLKQEAKERFESLAVDKAEQLGVQFNTIRLKDTTSRWGSCSAKKNLNFSWRLIAAPDFVSDYLVAHEVAHLKHLNHGKRFWQAADRLADNMVEAEKWLKKNGARLHQLQYNGNIL